MPHAKARQLSPLMDTTIGTFQFLITDPYITIHNIQTFFITYLMLRDKTLDMIVFILRMLETLSCTNNYDTIPLSSIKNTQ